MGLLSLRERVLSEERWNLAVLGGIERHGCGGFLVVVKSEGKESRDVDSAIDKVLKIGVVAADIFSER